MSNWVNYSATATAQEVGLQTGIFSGQNLPHLEIFAALVPTYLLQAYFWG
jgi:hypothetical protein